MTTTNKPLAVGDFRNQLAVVLGLAETCTTVSLLSNRARRAHINMHNVLPIEQISDEEMASFGDDEVAALAAWRMGL